jgi:dTDP-4-amino-4,6-dideoxygalactose transaminase
MQIPFVNLAKQFISIENELVQNFIDIGRSGGYIMGEVLETFEKNAATFLEVKHVLGVADGSDALFLIMHALGIGEGDEVITAPNSFIASAWTIIATGAKPVFVDVDQDLNINPKLIELAINEKTKAIMPVHLAGRPAKMDEISAIAKKYNLFVIEDSAQAIGARYKGKRVGGLSNAAGFSLHPLKNLGIYGDGGLIATNDDILYKKLKVLRNHGLINRDECEVWGYNSRLDTIQAAFANTKLKYLEKWNARCHEIAEIYKSNLTGVEIPVDQEWEYCVYHNFVIKTIDRDLMMQHLKENGVDTRIHYPIPIHLQNAAKDLGYKKGDFPNTEIFSKTMISLPIYPELTDEEVYYVIEKVNSFKSKQL